MSSILDSYCREAGLTAPAVTSTTTITSCHGQGNMISTSLITPSTTIVYTTSMTTPAKITTTPTRNNNLITALAMPHTTGENWSSSSEPNTRTSVQAKDIAFAALFGLTVALLVVVSIGWICTCWTMKKKRVKMR